MPRFNLVQCTSYLKKTFSAVCPNKTFNIPNWIRTFSPPQTPFNLDPPTYTEITNVIRKMKPSGSPCPLDQISIICLSLWKDTSCYKNVQYDTYQNTKHVLNSIRQEHEDRLQYNLVSDGSFFSNIIKHSTFSLNSLWSSVQSKLPKNRFNLTIRYVNNTLLFILFNVHSAWNLNPFSTSLLDASPI